MEDPTADLVSDLATLPPEEVVIVAERLFRVRLRFLSTTDPSLSTFLTHFSPSLDRMERPRCARESATSSSISCGAAWWTSRRPSRCYGSSRSIARRIPRSPRS
eukprot:scaffold109_cov252-Pinguiococcus_pyrenoidosus.AAC.13